MIWHTWQTLQLFQGGDCCFCIFLLHGRSTLIIYFFNIHNFSEIWGLLHVGGFL